MYVNGIKLHDYTYCKIYPPWGVNQSEVPDKNTHNHNLYTKKHIRLYLGLAKSAEHPLGFFCSQHPSEDASRYLWIAIYTCYAPFTNLGKLL